MFLPLALMVQIMQINGELGMGDRRTGVKGDGGGEVVGWKGEGG